MAFDLGNLMDELAAAVATIDGIDRTFAYPAEKVEPPCVVVAWPEEVSYDQTYGGLQHDWVIPVFVLLGRGGTYRTKRDTIAGWFSRDVKEAIDGATYTGDPIVVVTEAVLDIEEVGGIGYLAIKFLVDVTSMT